MQFETKALLLSAESKPYEIDGNKGVSHKIRLSVEGEIYVCKSTESQVQELQSKVKTSGDAVIEVVSRKENMTLKLVSFE